MSLDWTWLTILGYTDFRLSRYISHGKRQNESFPVWICSGTLINQVDLQGLCWYQYFPGPSDDLFTQWFVLTAAHCLRSREKKVRNVRLGEWLVQDDPYNTVNNREGPQAQLPDTQVRTAVRQPVVPTSCSPGLPSDGEELYSVRRRAAVPG